MSIIRDNAGNPISEENPLPMKLVDIGFIMPTDEQVRYAQTIQTHNAVSVPATNGTSDSAFIDCIGFDKLGLTRIGANLTMDVLWSHDGATTQGASYGILPNTVANLSGVEIPIISRYAKIRLNNATASAQTGSTWAYLKA